MFFPLAGIEPPDRQVHTVFPILTNLSRFSLRIYDIQLQPAQPTVREKKLCAASIQI